MVQTVHKRYMQKLKVAASKDFLLLFLLYSEYNSVKHNF